MQDFIEKNKNKIYNPPIPPRGLNSIELTEWLFHQDDMGWLKLDIEFDLEIWKKECSIAEKYYVNHRGSANYENSEHRGWHSCCIHGLGITNTEAEEQANQHLFHWTELSERTPAITKFWKEFPVENYRRLRFMCLEGNGYIGVHNDLPTTINASSLKDLDPLRSTISINVAIIHPTDCEFVTEKFGTVPMKEGEAYIINITKNHCVVNKNKNNRIHMIAECVVGDRLHDFSTLIYRSYKKQYGYN